MELPTSKCRSDRTNAEVHRGRAMTFTSNYIRTEANGRLRCQSAPRVAYRQLEASIGTLVVLLAVGFVAVISQHSSSNAASQAAIQEPARPAIVHTAVRVIPMYAPQSAVLAPSGRRS